MNVDVTRRYGDDIMSVSKDDLGFSFPLAIPAAVLTEELDCVFLPKPAFYIIEREVWCSHTRRFD